MDTQNVTGNSTGSHSGGLMRLDHCGWERQRFIPHAVRHLDHTTYPILLFIATVGNVLTIMILRKERPYGSKGIYLSAVAVIDLLYM
ncbi:hypothetical protein RvY_15996 [Ramazzottius varieornatus]|uniref:G-protein coupled receptors family 1 profile domain-containing protein n=1 Tax=Ramazzottius varieornatus TaxID=947166 RepID=A0A1D1VWV9_RAMVA|nr:hypothetical protein RvY_15996 [Ramazzottius varieornatus]